MGYTTVSLNGTDLQTAASSLTWQTKQLYYLLPEQTYSTDNIETAPHNEQHGHSLLLFRQNECSNTSNWT